MVGLYSDKETKIKNGTFRWFFPTGILKQMGKYKENKKEGTWLEWHSNGVLKDSSNYLNDHHHGISLSWYRNGYPKDSSNIDNNGNGIFAAWFDNGNPSEAGRYQNFKKAGKWVYYHANGNISSVETFNGDSLINFQYYDENGKPKSDSLHDYIAAQFKGGTKSWDKYFENNLRYPHGVELLNSDHIVVVLEATINENGKVSDVELSLPFISAFDQVAKKFLESSPDWLPAISHNRKVKETISIPIIFSQSFR